MLRLDPAAVRALKARVAAAWPEETCGFLFGREPAPAPVEVVTGLRNVDVDARGAFAADPGDAIRALQDAARHGQIHRAIFHSHPGRRGCPPSAAPSAADLRAAILAGEAAWPDVAHLIIGHVPDAGWAVSAFVVERGGSIRGIPVEGWWEPVV